MSDPITENKGITTQVGFVVFCECGATACTVRRRTRTAVAIECNACGRKLSVKGGLAPVRVNAGELLWIKQKQQVVYPDPDAGEVKQSTSATEPSPADDEQQTIPAEPRKRRRRLGFSVDDEQYTLIMRALEAIRIQYWREPHLRRSMWHAAALEMLSADALAGTDARVLSIMDRMDGIIAQEIAEYKERTGHQQVSDRRQREIRARVREGLYAAVFDEAETCDKERKPEEV